jgi:hypothetical protein
VPDTTDDLATPASFGFPPKLSPHRRRVWPWLALVGALLAGVAIVNGDDDSTTPTVEEASATHDDPVASPETQTASEEPVPPAPPEPLQQPAPAQVAAPGDMEAKLLTTVNGYVNAFASGQIAGILGYLDASCTDSDISEIALGASQMSSIAAGARITFTSVVVQGDRGSSGDYELSPGAPDALRRLMLELNNGIRTFPWNWMGGEWYYKGDCGQPDPTPEPTPTPFVPPLVALGKGYEHRWRNYVHPLRHVRPH